MKTINSVSVWKNGTSQTATKFSMVIISDNMTDVAEFQYNLLTSGNVPLVSGVLQISGVDYANWGGSNDAGYTWGATQLNLTIV